MVEGVYRKELGANFMNRLRQLRQEKKLTLKEVSKKLKENNFKISPDALAKYERGDREPKIETWEKLADYFNVPPSYLMGVTEKGDLMNVYLFQSTNCLTDQAIQNAIIVAKNRTDAIKKFSKELRNNPYCSQSYKSTWFSCKKINLNEPKTLIQYGGSTWQFNEVEYETE